MLFRSLVVLLAFHFDILELGRNLLDEHRLEVFEFGCVQARHLVADVKVEVADTDPVVLTDVTRANTVSLDNLTFKRQNSSQESAVVHDRSAETMKLDWHRESTNLVLHRRKYFVRFKQSMDVSVDILTLKSNVDNDYIITFLDKYKQYCQRHRDAYNIHSTKLKIGRAHV